MMIILHIQKNEYWTPRLQYLLENYFPYRTEIVFNQLKNLGLYPATSAPEYTSDGQLLTITNANEAGTVYYTTDGSDSRVAGGTVSDTAIEYTAPFAATDGTTVKARVKSGDEWSALSEVTLYA